MGNEFDLIVIGSGPGGYVAAIRAAQLGMRTAVVEKDPQFGGTCLHRGCIPTKALLHTASTLDEIREAGAIGIEVAAPRLDLKKAHEYKSQVVGKNAKGIEFLFKKNRIEGIHGFGRLTGPNQVTVERDGETVVYTSRFVLVATGSVPREIPIAPIDGQRILSSDHVLALDERVPESIAVLGAGAVGAEFASIYASFGSKVTLIEMLPRLLPIEDEEVSAELKKAFRKRRVQVMTGTALKAAETTESGVMLRLEREGEESMLEAEVLLVAVGRAPVSSSIGLGAQGVETDRGYVQVNEFMQTSVPTVYAIGDVIDSPWLAHVASSEGILAAEHMAGLEVRPIDYERVPSCTYCEPEVASVGLTEVAARDRGHEVVIGKFPFSALGKASILRRTAGFVKIVREAKYDEVLGVHIIGAHATDLIAEACVALQVESTTEELFRTMHAHPTLSEAVMEAAHAAFGHSIHS
ncbi:MAG: dihydrolipoyl dehydrogenase [bacterium]|nr:dihydrolipoyl dehydrogenase [bacterium]